MIHHSERGAGYLGDEKYTHTARNAHTEKPTEQTNLPNKKHNKTFKVYVLHTAHYAHEHTEQTNLFTLGKRDPVGTSLKMFAVFLYRL